jgi:lysozyme family protein
VSITEAPASKYPAEFESAIERIFADEGGFVANSADPGGATKFGISAREYPDLDIKNLTRADAIAIYYRDWWLKYDFGRLPSMIAGKTFDLAVNIGPAHAITCMQRALRAAGHRVSEDGAIGDETARSAAASEEPVLMAALRSEAAGYYRAVAAITRGARDGGDAEFLSGWLNRAYE